MYQIKRKINFSSIKKRSKDSSNSNSNQTNDDSSTSTATNDELNDIKEKVISIAKKVIDIKQKRKILSTKEEFHTILSNKLIVQRKDIVNEICKLEKKKKMIQDIFFCLIYKFFPQYLPNVDFILTKQINNNIDLTEIIKQSIDNIEKSFLFNSMFIQNNGRNTNSQSSLDNLFKIINPKYHTLQEWKDKTLHQEEHLCSSNSLIEGYLNVQQFNPVCELIFCEKIRNFLNECLNKLDDNLTITEIEQNELLNISDNSENSIYAVKGVSELDEYEEIKINDDDDNDNNDNSSSHHDLSFHRNLMINP